MPKRELKTFDQAFNALDQTAQDSTKQITRSLVPFDLKLQGVLNFMRPEYQATVRDLKNKSLESLETAKEKAIELGRDAAKRVDRQAHKSPWAFVGFAALFSAIFGFFLGRKTKE